ncbi:MAG: hypothetical protein JWM11_4682 [Planctomycetaceae bacterium]|nr:hypothetical protein [Planctomycetaceae bacterium]
MVTQGENDARVSLLGRRSQRRSNVAVIGTGGSDRAHKTSNVMWILKFGSQLASVAGRNARRNLLQTNGLRPDKAIKVWAMFSSEDRSKALTVLSRVAPNASSFQSF